MSKPKDRSIWACFVLTQLLVIALGIILYFDEQQIQTMARDLALVRIEQKLISMSHDNLKADYQKKLSETRRIDSFLRIHSR